MVFKQVDRAVSRKVRDLLNYFSAVAIVGARQTGKTTLAKILAPDWQYVDLESPDDYTRVSFDTKLFFRQYPRHLIIDEAQEFPQLFNTLRGVIDEHPNETGRFILTGSSSLELLESISESLPGRIAIIELGTLKASEVFEKPLSPFYDLFGQSLDKKHLPQGKPPISLSKIQHVWLKGGYPKPVLTGEDEFYQQWMENYHQTYINRDIAKRFPRLNKVTYQRFLGMLSHLSGTMMNKSEIGRAVQVSEKTISEYMNIAEGTFIFRLLRSYEGSIEQVMTKMPKGYLRDTGLLHYLLRIKTLEQLQSHPTVGKSFESYVIEELNNGLRATMATGWQFSYYRTVNKAEIDLLIEGSFGLLPIEIKRGMVRDRRKLSTLSGFVREHQLPFGLLINQSDHAEWITDEIFQLPVGWL